MFLSHFFPSKPSAETMDTTKEVKYERVEKVDVDKGGSIHVKDVREDRGKEDPGMNYQDKRPANLVPGASAGVVPNLSETELRNRSNISSSASGFVEPSLIRNKGAGEFTTVHESSSSSSQTSSGTGSTISGGTGARNMESSLASSGAHRMAGSDASSLRSSGATGAARGMESSMASTETRRMVGSGETSSLRSGDSSTHSSIHRSQHGTMGGVGPDVTTISGGGAARGMESSMASSETRRMAGSDTSSIRSGDTSVSSSIPRSHHGITGGAGPGVTLTNQRTTVVTEQLEGIGQYRTVPILPHREHQEREVIHHESHSRAPETTVITIPINRFESANMESTRTGRTYTEDKVLTIPAPVIAPQIHGMTNLDLSSGTSAEIHATSDIHLATEAQIKDMGPEEYARYRQKVEELARQHEMETSKKAAEYRTEVERDAELIRQTLERQHIRDIEFRKDLVESAVDRQQHEIQLEAEYAMRALEQEREAARMALEKAKASTHIDVNIDSAIGTTHSEGKVTTTTERRTEEVRGPGSARDVARPTII
jgi:hypothetical protein